jgi:A/G-specific adenine glycosylase
MTERDFNFGQQLAQWYQMHKRDLPWRNTNDPYLIWLSEVILQQTRVAQGLPYYEKFAATYPTVIDLAAASEQEVLRLWQGLGYYSRARNMHTTARMVVEKYDGIFPGNYSDLLQLKGIGPYTAAAIASFASNEPVAVVDGNVYRVLSRVYGIADDVDSHKGKQFFRQYAQQLLQECLPLVEPSIYNQAIMEFGAIHCMPVTPSCNNCIFKQHCYAYANTMQAQLPVKEKKIKIKQRNFVYFIFEYEGQILMKERGNGDIWQGLYDFPMVEEREGKLIAFSELIQQIYEQILPLLSLRNLAAGTLVSGYPLQIAGISDTYKHQLTHQSLLVQFLHLKVTSADFWQQVCQLGVLSVSHAKLEDLPKPVLLVNYLQKYFF